ncbi:MAG: sensor histidine kinase [Syntrophobacteraceae bacterium]
MNYPVFDQIVDSLSDALITVDRNKEIVIWNKMAETMFGYDKVQIEAAGLEAIIPPAYRQRHREGYEAFLSSIDTRDSYVSEPHEFEGIRKNGEIFPLELTHSLVKLDDGQFFITALVRDIGLRKRYEVMRERFERITYHDLKNKLVIVCLAAQRLSKGLGAVEKSQAATYTDIILSESKGLIDLLDSTKELLLLETGEYKRKDERIELAELLRLKAQHMQPFAAARGVQVVFNDRAEPGIAVQGDRQLFERAIENLLKNAVEAEDSSNAVEMSLREGENKVPVIEIHNGGKPIPEELRDLIFSAYVTHGKKEGTGLGLYAAKLILETIHGWRISFRSGTEGTTFTVTLG